MDYGKHTGMVIKKNRIGLANKEISLNEKNALADEIEDFLRAVRETTETGVLSLPKVPGEQGLRALKLAVDIIDNIREYNDRYGFKFT